MRTMKPVVRYKIVAHLSKCCPPTKSVQVRALLKRQKCKVKLAVLVSARYVIFQSYLRAFIYYRIRNEHTGKLWPRMYKVKLSEDKEQEQATVNGDDFAGDRAEGVRDGGGGGMRQRRRLHGQ